MWVCPWTVSMSMDRQVCVGVSMDRQVCVGVSMDRQVCVGVSMGRQICVGVSMDRQAPPTYSDIFHIASDTHHIIHLQGKVKVLVHTHITHE